MTGADHNSEEMQRLIEEQKKKVEAMLAAMTPEERAEAERRFAALQQADSEAMQKTVEAARRVMEMNTAQEHHAEPYPGATVPEAAKAAEKPPRFCPNCGAPADGGAFCAYCGSPLKAK